MFRKMPCILLFIILAILCLGSSLPVTVKQTLFSLSLSIKAVILFLLPFIVFSLLFKSAVKLSRNATKVIFIILSLVCVSNLFSTFLSHYVGAWIYHLDLSMIPPNEASGLMPLWTLALPKWIPNNIAMFMGIILGILASKFYPAFAHRLADNLDRVVTGLLHKFIYFIPLFVAGFVVKLHNDNILSVIAKDYTRIFGTIAVAQFSYILLGFFIINKTKITTFMQSIKNMLPAAISGFTTMSSAASMPLTIMGAENNGQNKELMRAVIPATVNIHLVGDCFAIPIFAYAVLKSFGMPDPSLYAYLVFTLYFVLAKFSVAAIPGGGILVMLPILESYLGFNAEMMSLITALYILFDPVITCANVLGNGAFAQLLDKMTFIFKPLVVKREESPDRLSGVLPRRRI